MRILGSTRLSVLSAGLAGLIAVAPAHATPDPGLPRPWEASLSLGPGIVFDVGSGNAVLTLPVAGWGSSGRGPDVNVALFYNSTVGAAAEDPSGSCELGDGWGIAFATTTLETIDPTHVELRRSDSARIAFTKSGGTWSCTSPGYFVELDDLGPPSAGVTQGGGPPPPALRWTATFRDGTVEEYDDLGRLMTIADASGNELEVEHSLPSQALPRGTVDEITDASGRSIAFEYDQGRLARIVDEHNAFAPWELVYDGSGRLVQVLDIDATQLFGIGYDAAGLVDEWTDPASEVWSFEYDAGGRLTSFTDALGTDSTDFAYATIAGGTTTTVTDKRDEDWIYEFDAAGRAVEFTNPLGDSWASSYDADNNLTSTTSPLGHSASATYDGSGRLLTYTTPEGHTTTRTYDAAGNLATQTNATGETWTRSHADVDNPRSATTLTEPPDGLGLPVAEHDQSWFGPATPGWRGRPDQFVDETGVSTRTSWDGSGRLTTTEHGLPGGTRAVVQSSSWSPFGNVTGTTIQAWSSSLPAFPSAPPIPASPITGTLERSGVFHVDWTGAVTDVTTTILSPLPGELASTRVLDVARDAIGRLACRTVTTNEATQVSGGNGQSLVSTVTVTYDDQNGTGRLETDTGLALEWTSDAAGRTSSLSSFQGTTPGPGVTYSYDDDGRLERKTRSNGTYVDLTWHADGRVDELLEYGPSGQLRLAFDYAYDARGLPVSVVEYDGVAVSTTSYSYDDRRRLVSEIRVGSFPFEIHYAYDQLGNRTQKTEVEGSSTTVTTYTYDVDTPGGVAGSFNHRLLYAEEKVGGVLSVETWYVYDHAAGHVSYVVSREAGSSTYEGTRFLYDSDATLYLTIDEEYSLDAGGQPTNHVLVDAWETRQSLFEVYRRARRDPATWALASDAWSDSLGLLPLVDYQVDATAARTDQQLHVGAEALLDALSGAGTYRHADRQSTERMLTDGSGSVLGGGLYTAFGELVFGVGSTRNGYVGGTGAEASLHPADSELNLVRTGMRYLDTRSGRYLMQDPIGIWGGANTYAYAGNRPSAQLDPFGLAPQDRGYGDTGTTDDPNPPHDDEVPPPLPPCPLCGERSCEGPPEDGEGPGKNPPYQGPGSETMPPVLTGPRLYWTGFGYETMPPDLSRSKRSSATGVPRTEAGAWARLTRQVGEFTSRLRPR